MNGTWRCFQPNDKTGCYAMDEAKLLKSTREQYSWWRARGTFL